MGPASRNTPPSFLRPYAVVVVLQVAALAITAFISHSISPETHLKTLFTILFGIQTIGVIYSLIFAWYHRNAVITWRNNLEKDLQEKVRNSQVTSLSDLAAGIAHEINNPLSIVSGMNHALNRKFSDQISEDPGLSSIIENLRAGTFRVAEIVKSLRRFARTDDDHTIEKIPLSTIVTETLNLCRQKISAEDVRLQLERIPQSVQLECAPSLISKVILNIINNALDAVKDKDEKWIRLSFIDESEFLTIAIVDSGRGIEKSMEQRIFHPFVTTKEIGSGTGLGLSQALGICLEHGGDITLDLEASHTTFLITLPKIQSEFNEISRFAA